MEIKCETCGFTGVVPEEWDGKKIACPKCKNEFVVGGKMEFSLAEESTQEVDADTADEECQTTDEREVNKSMLLRSKICFWGALLCWGISRIMPPFSVSWSDKEDAALFVFGVGAWTFVNDQLFRRKKWARILVWILVPIFAWLTFDTACDDEFWNMTTALGVKGGLLAGAGVLFVIGGCLLATKEMRRYFCAK